MSLCKYSFSFVFEREALLTVGEVICIQAKIAFTDIVLSIH